MEEEVAILKEEALKRRGIEEQALCELLESYPLRTGLIKEFHSSAATPWIIVNGKAYDCTAWQKKHPVGPAIIRKNAGVDCSNVFNRAHSNYAKRLLRDFCLGTIVADGQSFDEAFATAHRAAIETEEASHEVSVAAPKSLKVEKVEKLTENVKKITFRFQAKDYVLPLVPGGHLSVTIPTHENTFRSYTPPIIEPGRFSFVVKAYAGGKGSTYLHGLKKNDLVAMRGPIEPMFDIREARGVSHITMLAAGTGICPILAIAAEALRPPPAADGMNDGGRDGQAAASPSDGTPIPEASAADASSTSSSVSASRSMRVTIVACFEREGDKLLDDLVRRLAQSPEGRARFRMHYIWTGHENSRHVRCEDSPLDNIFYHSGKCTRDKVMECGYGKACVQDTECGVVCGPVDFNQHFHDVLWSFGFRKDRITLLQ